MYRLSLARSIKKRSKLLNRLIELSKIYGTVWKFTLPKINAVFVAEPDLVQEVIANPANFPKVPLTMQKIDTL